MANKEYRFFGLKLSTDKDADIISLLESRKNMQGFIKEVLNEWIELHTGSVLEKGAGCSEGHLD